MGDEQSGGLPSVEPVPAYDLDAVDRFVAAANGRRRDLQEKVEAARARIEVAEGRIAAAAALHTALGSLVLDAQRRITDLRRENERAIEAILEAADAEARTILGLAELELALQPGDAAAPAPLVAPEPVLDLSAGSGNGDAPEFAVVGGWLSEGGRS